MPIDTAVAATAVDSASAAVVINSISAMGRCGGVGASCASRLLAPRTINLFTMSISTNRFAFVAADAGAGSAGLGRRLWRIRAILCFWLTKG